MSWFYTCFCGAEQGRVGERAAAGLEAGERWLCCSCPTGTVVLAARAAGHRPLRTRRWHGQVRRRVGSSCCAGLLACITPLWSTSPLCAHIPTPFGTCLGSVFRQGVFGLLELWLRHSAASGRALGLHKTGLYFSWRVAEVTQQGCAVALLRDA